MKLEPDFLPEPSWASLVIGYALILLWAVGLCVLLEALASHLFA